MSELFRCGFEDQVLTGIWSAVTNAVVDTADGKHHSGSWSMKIFPTGSTARHVRRDITGNPTTGTYYSRFYIYATAVAAGVDVTITEHRSSGNVSELIVRLMRDNKIRLENTIAGSTDTQTSTTAISLNTWYRIEVEHILSASASMTLKLYLGDSLTALDTLVTVSGNCVSTNLGSIYYGQGPTTATSGTTLYYDDIGLNSDAGSAPFNTWLGPGKMYAFTGVSDVASGWTRSGGASNFDMIDETPGAVPDDITTYNSVVTNSVEDRFGITSPLSEVPSNAVMKCMSLWGKYSNDAANTNTYCLKIWNEAGTGTQGPTITYALTTWTTTLPTTHQSFDLTGKTKGDLDLFNIGYRSLTGGAAKRFSAIFGHVEWIESAGQTLGVDSGSLAVSGQSTNLRLGSPLYLRYRK